ncbi:DUF3949 domain-containing protein [Bacillus sp. T33-2]|uniref:DUF3949 domain-containing protein n=1 Tax=Bacillus sp. T33-2 TaxID=2054168 RepID=UPI000C758D5B|nr:DUF3949 domain-containing protein [Bacillus sp. T33-2]PLR89816.1 hypothetical protein CVD19_23330 [Bacillus sp. T33-2]
MGLYATLGIIGAYILLSLILLPIQYRYISQLKENTKRQRELGVTQEEYYDKMSFESQELHVNAQGNPLFLGANLFASLLYNWKQKKK